MRRNVNGEKDFHCACFWPGGGLLVPGRSHYYQGQTIA